ncbi:MAG TPA: hypothetical protein VII55_02995 [Candidatus Saccharimonadales bacterium]
MAHRRANGFCAHKSLLRFVWALFVIFLFALDDPLSLGCLDGVEQLIPRLGDDVQWLLNTSNGPWSTVYHVITRDILPPNLQLDPRSVVFTNARGREPLADAPLFGGGYDAGAYNPGDNTLIAFKTKALSNFTGCKVIDRNEGYARSDQTPVEVTNDADVVITKPNCSK